MNSEFTVAVHSLVLLAYLPDHMASSETIARNVTTNPTRIRKIMSTLRKSGYVRTKEGIGGGYILSCDPKEVTLAEIYRVLSGGALKPHWCSGNPEEECLVSANIQVVMDHFFYEAELHYEAYLEQNTLQTVLDKIRQCQQKLKTKQA
ncbi:Rrf2 family transcriptional regulator [Paenibacillus arenilitoris]|uniref:Rrf2 family transcriptional regulator n=1 Tax=Paenibacillus arenilitoris TaxID=2772299 RepID=A0A927CLI3_9BACL|nr:Rrf2 family transcriptional regulator [Paenibacillus arenilitoris]MBD2869412.1 Rrf2 family transcriptional regulator [Paenibacillus arenilitoris]